MALAIPNVADAANPDQAEPDSKDFEILVAGDANNGVISGCAVTAQASPDMTLAVASGSVNVGSAVGTVASGNVTITTADATNPRFDLVVASSAGAKSVTAGTASSNPVFPTIPASSVVLAAVYVAAGVTSITNANIVDKRVILAAYALLGGKAGGQTLSGGTASGEHLTLQATSHATKGAILTDTSVRLRALADETFTATPFWLSSGFSSTAGARVYTFNPASNANYGSILLAGGTMLFDVSGNAAGAGAVVRNAMTIKNVPAEANNLGAHFLFWDSGLWRADGATITLVSKYTFYDQATYDVVNAGVLNITNLISFVSIPGVLTGATATLRAGLQVLDATGTGTITTQVGVDIGTLTRGTTNIGVRNAAPYVATPSTAQVLAAGTAILANAEVVQVTSSGSITSTAAPTIADGVDGQRLTIINVDSADTITLQDQGTLASSNLRLVGVSAALAPRESITLIYNSTIGDWVELSRSGNVT